MQHTSNATENVAIELYYGIYTLNSNKISKIWDKIRIKNCNRSKRNVSNYIKSIHICILFILYWLLGC